MTPNDYKNYTLYTLSGKEYDSYKWIGYPITNIKTKKKNKWMNISDGVDGFILTMMFAIIFILVMGFAVSGSGWTLLVTLGIITWFGLIMIPREDEKFD